MIGGLQYLANNTRPDITYAFNHLARFLINPPAENFQASRRILKYTARDPDRGIVFTNEGKNPIFDAY